MTDQMHLDTHTAEWRIGAVRTRLHLCPTMSATGITNVYGTKPGAKADFPATATTRRGAPPH